MLWYEKKLTPREIEVLMGMLDQSHSRIITEIRKMVDDFAAQNVYGRDPDAKSESTESLSSESSSEF